MTRMFPSELELECGIGPDANLKVSGTVARYRLSRVIMIDSETRVAWPNFRTHGSEAGRGRRPGPAAAGAARWARHLQPRGAGPGAGAGRMSWQGLGPGFPAVGAAAARRGLPVARESRPGFPGRRQEHCPSRGSVPGGPGRR